MTGKQWYATRTVEMVTDADRGLSVRTNATAGELIEAWFKYATGDFSPKTVKETRGFIDRNLLPAIGAVPLSKLKASDLDRLYRRLQATGAVGDGGLAPATVRRIHGILRLALAQGVKWGWLGVNPAAATRHHRAYRSRRSRHRPVPLRSGPFDGPGSPRRNWRATSCWRRRPERDGPSWWFCGGAISTFPDGAARIERGVVMGPAGLVEKDTKTHAARRVALDDRTVQIIGAHRARMTARAAMCRAELTDDAFVFSNAGDCSEPWFPDPVSRGFKRLCVAEGLPDVWLHDLRHFVASELLSAGVDVRTVAGRLGHRNAATTLNVYAHFLEKADRGAADVIGRVIAGDPDGIEASGQ